MANPTSVGAFVPTTNVWDVSQLYAVEVTSPEFKELLVRLYQNINNIANVLNIKDSGYYPLSEFVNGQLYFPNPALSSASSTYPACRPVWRLAVNFGALPNAATKSVAHGLTANSALTSTRVYAAASDTTGFNYIPIPYASNTAGNSIELNVDATNVNITTGSDRTNFTVCYVVFECLKQ